MTIERYLAAFENTWADDTPAAQVRFVVLDTETTGLDPRRDKIITIGALAVRDGEILLDDAFEVLLKIAYNNSSVTVHGITRDEAVGRHGRGGGDGAVPGLPARRRDRGPPHRPRYRRRSIAPASGIST